MRNPAGSASFWPMRAVGGCRGDSRHSRSGRRPGAGDHRRLWRGSRVRGSCVAPGGVQRAPGGILMRGLTLVELVVALGIAAVGLTVAGLSLRTLRPTAAAMVIARLDSTRADSDPSGPSPGRNPAWPRCLVSARRQRVGGSHPRGECSCASRTIDGRGARCAAVSEVWRCSRCSSP